MKTFDTIDRMRSFSRTARREGKRIAFVPTMGALHEGHLSLMREGKRHADYLVVSIYVNPTQFGPNEDLAAYPRNLAGDLDQVRSVGGDAVFLPTDAIMYPEGAQTRIDVPDIARHLCGASRPGHFSGVATVVAKLFHIVEPDIALFGEKDFQQLAVIRRMVQDLGLPVEIVGCPIVREADGLAMSSRNRYLSPQERTAATSLSRALDRAGEMIGAGETSAKRILGEVREIIEATGIPRIDYATLVDPETLEEIPTVQKDALLALAAFVGPARLIDNRLFDIAPRARI